MAYTRTYVIDATPGGDTVKGAVATKLDGDLTNAYTYLNAHDIATTSVHGFTGAKTGSGAMVGATTPTLVTPVLGVATATSINKVTITAPATTAVLTIAEGKTFTCSNTLTLTATDGSTLAIGTGGTLGTAAYTAATAYEASGAISTHAALITGVHGLVFTAGKTLTLTESLTLGAAAAGAIRIATSANTIGDLAVGLTTQILVGGGAGTVPAWGTDLPTAVTIGSAYIYRAGGTDVAVADGGTGVSTLTTAYGLLAAGTTATGTVQTLAAGATTEILVGGGASALPAWTTATGTGAPVRADSATLTTKTILPTVYIGDDSNANITLGLTINQGSADNGLIAGKSSDMNHAVTDNFENDSYFDIRKTHATIGGVSITGITDTDYEGALLLRGIIGATGLSTNAAVVISGAILSTNTYGTMAAGEEVLQIKNHTTDLVTVLGSGNVGIGDTAPASKLVVNGGITETGGVLKSNLLTNSQWMAMSGSTLENVRALPDATSVATGTSIASDAHLLTAGKLVKDAAGTPLVFEVISVTANAFVVDRTGWTDGQAYEVTPGYVAADAVAPDGWQKNVADFDIFREHSGTNTKAGSFYALKTVTAGTGKTLLWPSATYANLEVLAKFTGRTVSFGCWVKASDASHVRLAVYDGNFTYSSYHTGGGSYEWLELTHTFGASPSYAQFILYNDVSGKTAYFSQPMSVFGSSIGSGNFAPAPDEELMYATPFVLTGYSAAVPADATINLEAASSGKIGKGIKRLFGYHYGQNTAANKYLLLGTSTGITHSRLVSQVANIPISLPFDVKCDSNGDMYIDVEDANWSAYNLYVTGVQT